MRYFWVVIKAMKQKVVLWQVVLIGGFGCFIWGRDNFLTSEWLIRCWS